MSARCEQGQLHYINTVARLVDFGKRVVFSLRPKCDLGSCVSFMPPALAVLVPTLTAISKSEAWQSSPSTATVFREREGENFVKNNNRRQARTVN